MLRACLIALGLGWPALALSAAADPPPAAAETAPADAAPAATDAPAAQPAAEPAAAPEQPAPVPAPDPNAPAPTPAPVPADPAAPAPADAPAPAPTPAPEPKLEPAAAPAEAKAPEVPAEEGVKAEAEKKEPGTIVGFLGYELPVSFRALMQYRQLTVVDGTPNNDRWGNFDFSLSFKPAKRVSAFLTFGVMQKGWAEPGESGGFFKDMALGAAYAHPIALDGLGIGLYQKQQAKLSANVRLWLPTSRASSRQELYLAPEVRLAASAPVLPDWVELGLELRSNYRFHKYAERYGSWGSGYVPQNTRFTLQAIPFLEVEFLKLGRFGTVNFEADLWWLWALSYPSRDHHSTSVSGADYWQQQFGWDLGIAYRPKPWAKVGVSLEQGGNVLREGIVNMFYDLRDEMELAVSLELLF